MKRRSWLYFFQDKAGKFRWRVQASNGKIIASSSQGFTTEVSRLKNLQSLGALLNDPEFMLKPITHD